ncbi:uncharacterized protein LOC113281486 [Papaver somniferum]|uniref:uncharacterized protein LOC113281486 n=1 Tax=Papaver somniferum TaxID=3469 RepID=UPI000E6F49A0|nr:uncharacterized protein LOC113281486 [Papaver somniferum]
MLMCEIKNVHELSRPMLEMWKEGYLWIDILVSKVGTKVLPLVVQALNGHWLFWDYLKWKFKLYSTGLWNVGHNTCKQFMKAVLNSAGNYHYLLLTHVTYGSLIVQGEVGLTMGYIKLEFYDRMVTIQLMFLYTPSIFVLVVFLRWNLFSTCFCSTKGVMVLILLQEFACMLLIFSPLFISLENT